MHQGDSNFQEIFQTVDFQKGIPIPIYYSIFHCSLASFLPISPSESFLLFSQYTAHAYKTFAKSNTKSISLRRCVVKTSHSSRDSPHIMNSFIIDHWLWFEGFSDTHTLDRSRWQLLLRNMSLEGNTILGIATRTAFESFASRYMWTLKA